MIAVKIYHGTGCENAGAISREGLKASGRESRWPEESMKTTDFEKLAPTGVYLTRSIDSALYFGREASRSGDVCIFEVTCLANGARIGSDGWGDEMTDKPVPPGCLRLIPRPEIATMVGIDEDALDGYIDGLR